MSSSRLEGETRAAPVVKTPKHALVPNLKFRGVAHTLGKLAREMSAVEETGKAEGVNRAK